MVTVRESTVAPECPHPCVFSQLQQAPWSQVAAGELGGSPRSPFPEVPLASQMDESRTVVRGNAGVRVGWRRWSRAGQLPPLTRSRSRFSLTSCGGRASGGQRTVVRSPPPYPCCSLVRFAPEGSARSGQREKVVQVSRLAGCAGRGHRDDGIYTHNWGGRGRGRARAAAGRE